MDRDNAPPSARLIDALLERTIVPSFSRLGPAARRRLFDWGPLPALDGRVVVVTGATSGVGRAIAEGAARRGALVHFLARDDDKATELVRDLERTIENVTVTYGIADLTELDSLEEFVESVPHSHVDVLMHNAGLLSREHEVTDGGVELTTAVHLVGPYVLTRRMLPLLRAAPRPARVVLMSSGGMYARGLDVDAIPPGAEDYDGRAAYALTKRAQVVLAEQWARRVPTGQMTFHSMHPGWVATPGVSSGLPLFDRVMQPLLREPAAGADTAVWLMGADLEEEPNAGFWHDRAPRAKHLAPWTRSDTDEGARLLARLEELSGVPWAEDGDQGPQSG